ncbi:MAG: hypothetical protein HY369_04125 [Candidatus Aenigmarchaeota archaeon]|nr:hypothetical protein [Candidatus Aenigmarchaeota archaeon]
MHVTIAREKDNPLLHRKEVVAEVNHPGAATPKREELVILLAKALKGKEDHLIIDLVRTRAGVATCEVRAHLYASKDQIPKAQLAFHERRLGKAKPAAVEGAEKPATEKPAE